MSEQTPVINVASAELKLGGNGTKFVNEGARLSPKIGLKKLGFSFYVVPASKRAFPYHAHSLIEEACFVLEGSGTLRHEGKEYPVKAGDLIASPCGAAHQIVNTSDSDLKYLAISANELADVVLYPDSGKIGAYSGVLGSGVSHLTKVSAAVDYFSGEE